MVESVDIVPGQSLEHTFPPTLADLSRNASVISSSSDSETSTNTALWTPRPRPTRTFSSPRSRSPHSPPSQAVRPPAYLTRELGVSVGSEHPDLMPEPVVVSRLAQPRSKSRKPSRSQNPSANTRLSAQDFQFGETLGEGSYSTVMRARYTRSGQEYAIKILDKNHLIRKEKMLVALAEKNVLVKLGAGHPGIIHLHWTFQDEWSLFFVLDLAPNGEMQSRISRLGSLSLACARYYTAQIVDAIEYMHDKDVIHRDLKPENLLLDSEFRIKITDFGTGKILENGRKLCLSSLVHITPFNAWNCRRTRQFVRRDCTVHCSGALGTQRDVQEVGVRYFSIHVGELTPFHSSDLWSLGCIVFQMIAGRFAFQGLSEYLTWQKIKSLEYSFPEGFDQDAKDFVSTLLVRDPQQRLGASRTPSSPSLLRSHPFLASINWNTLWTDPPPPLDPGLVKKEPQNHTGLLDVEDARWNDVGARWDALVGTGDDDDVGETEGTMVNDNRVTLAHPPVDHDGIVWAGDAQGAEFERYKLTTGMFKRASRIVEEVGPTGEVPDYTLTTENGGAHVESGPTATANETKEVDKDTTIPPTSTSLSIPTPTPIPIPSNPHNGNPPGSGNNSSDGSLVDKSNVAVAIAVQELERGRNRALTPVQGNGRLRDADFSSLLLLGEIILFSTRVEARSPKRRGSKLRLPISVSPIRTKTRQLLLTTHRLLCVKQRVEGDVGLKSELSLRKGVNVGSGTEKTKEREKEAKSIVESAERKSEREFVVLTSTKSQTYAAESGAFASLWVDKINSALSLPRSPA
ncbi:kinase-like domain-containing protein [Boletus edulis BED1]|uniref:non-specific serine/threonine protein kinase n=1 Tax=Boletus edulis BED1 TaxID=1328754 RepID=A0AAD4GFT4_BOLED|nr:kinase-like domain-containing protein [Boletus edulis BED1]